MPDFVRNYLFAPYQFQLLRKIFEAIRKAGATGLHLSRGERSILDAFQSAGKQVGPQEVGILVPLYRFYPSIESFLDTVVKRTIDQARDNASLEQPFDIYLLQVLFLIRYVEEIQGNVDNLVTLCMEEIDADRLALRRQVEEGRKQLVTLLGEMLAGASYHVAGQSLKLKAATPMDALDEALEYLVRNTFTKMGYLQRLNSEPLKEVQAILRSNDIGQQTPALEKEEGNKQAIDDLRSYLEMGPDGEDTLFNFLQNQLKDWQSSLDRYKPLADTGDYPGKDEMADGLVLVKKLLACDGSYKFIEQFNDRKDALLDLADQLSDLEHFYSHQKPTWEKLRKAFERFQLNRMELDRDPQAGPSLKRIQEILTAPSPYGLIQQADGLISTVGMVNTDLVTERRQQAIERIEGYIAALTGEIEAAHGEAGLRSACLKPLESLLSLVHTENSLAHISHAEGEALKEFDAAVLGIEEYVKEAVERSTEGGPGTEPGQQPKPVIKKQRIVEPARLVQKAYLEQQWNTDLRYENSLAGSPQVIELVDGAKDLTGWIQARVRRSRRRR